MNEITLLHEFAAAGTSTAYRVTGPALLVQTDGITATLQGTNFPAIEASWQGLGQCTGYTPLTVTTSFAYIRVVASGAGRVAVAGASAPAAGAGGGGGGGGDASAAHQVTQIARLDTLITQTDGLEAALGLLATAAQMATLLAQTDGVESALGNIDSKTPALSGGKVPVIDTENRDLSQTIAARLGATDDAAAASDGATASQIALQKRALVHLSSLLTQATNFRPVLSSTQSLAVTATSSAAQAVTAGEVIRFSNAGSKAIAVMFGTSGVVASYATALDIMPGSSEAITVPAGATHFAAICNTGDTGTLKWTRGTGL